MHLGWRPYLIQAAVVVIAFSVHYPCTYAINKKNATIEIYCDLSDLPDFFFLYINKIGMLIISIYNTATLILFLSYILSLLRFFQYIMFKYSLEYFNWI